MFPRAFFSPKGGWANSGATLEWLLSRCSQNSLIRMVVGRVARIESERGAVRAVVLENGQRLISDTVVVTAGAFTPFLVPQTRELLKPVAQFVMHYKVSDETTRRTTPVYFADISHTGFYGFPLHDTAGVMKVGNHGRGFPMNPERMSLQAIEEVHRAHKASEEKRFRAFLAQALPSLGVAEVVHTRACLYCDTPDGDFLIDWVPGCAGLFVASGDSGHAFKFAPVLGRLIVDRFRRLPDRPHCERFAWRAAQSGKLDVARAVEPAKVASAL